jgi:hypothetical protein
MSNHDEAIRKAAQALGKKGGSAKTTAKIKAAQENGKRGGRPRKAKPQAQQDDATTN